MLIPRLLLQSGLKVCNLEASVLWSGAWGCGSMQPNTCSFSCAYASIGYPQLPV